MRNSRHCSEGREGWGMRKGGRNCNVCGGEVKNIAEEKERRGRLEKKRIRWKALGTINKNK